MKWPTTKIPPQIGDHRRVTRFAWWPRKCNDGNTYLWCRITVLQKFSNTVSMGVAPPPIPSKEWLNIEWGPYINNAGR